ncbi:MAG: hypothetical protein JSS29_04625 [Proteobacteria bacterium]|nr:hypothetical protein [Pseudomonadota bacterium]
MDTDHGRVPPMTRWRLTASGAMRLRIAPQLNGPARSLDLAVAAQVLELAAIALIVAGLVVAWL